MLKVETEETAVLPSEERNMFLKVGLQVEMEAGEVMLS